MNINMTEKDFEQLCGTSMQWGTQWRVQGDRFENMSEGRAFDDPPSWDWDYAYWLEDGAAALILAKAFLADMGVAFEVLWDTADGFTGYVLVTDYAYPAWKRA